MLARGWKNDMRGEGECCLSFDEGKIVSAFLGKNSSSLGFTRVLGDGFQAVGRDLGGRELSICVWTISRR